MSDVNPFATRFTRPGSIPYRFPASVTVDLPVNRLEACGWRGQIVGAHGSGKTSLLHTLEPELMARGRRLAWYTQRDGQRSLAATSQEIASWNQHTLVIVDGYEQLSWLARRRLRWQCWQSGAGLLVTSHADTGLPLLLESIASPELALEVVSELKAAPLIEPEDVSRCYHQHAGNLRETLFALYDLYEERRRK